MPPPSSASAQPRHQRRARARRRRSSGSQPSAQIAEHRPVRRAGSARPLATNVTAIEPDYTSGAAGGQRIVTAWSRNRSHRQAAADTLVSTSMRTGASDRRRRLRRRRRHRRPRPRARGAPARAARGACSSAIGRAVGASVRNFGHVFVTGVADGEPLRVRAARRASAGSSSARAPDLRGRAEPAR